MPRMLLLHPDWTFIGQLALPASLLLLAASLLLLTLALARQRRQHGGDLARIFEQLDLLRFDAQQAAAAPASVVPFAPPARSTAASAVAAPAGAAAAYGASDYYAAAQLAARGSSAVEIAGRCGIVNGEARVLVALQQARARRGAKG
jgi:hypothetical protein